MKRFDRTIIANLKPGDRFYVKTDRRKNVFQVVEHGVKKTFFQTYKYFACPIYIVESQVYHTAQKERFYKAFKPLTEVVYLRSITKHITQ